MGGKKLLFLCLDRMPTRLPDEMITLIVFFATFLSVTDETIHILVRRWCCYKVFPDEQKFGHISDWDVSQVTNMVRLFASSPTFNNDISRWNVSNVTHMSNMFTGSGKDVASQ